MGEVFNNFLFSLSKIGSADEKRAEDTAEAFQKSFIEYYLHASDKVKRETTQWGMYALQLNRERLDKKGLSMQVILKNARNNVSTVLARRDGRYTTYEVHKFMTKRLIFRKNGKKVKEYNKDCEMVLDVIESMHSQDKYNCPCCGNMDVLENFFEGCKYCGTQFNFEDFQHKVNYVRFKDTAMVAFHGLTHAILYIRELALCCGGLGAFAYLIIINLMPYFGKIPPEGMKNILMGIIGSFIYGAFLGGLAIFAGSIILSLLVSIIVNPIVTVKYDEDMRNNNKIAAQIRKRDAGFSTEAVAAVLNSRMQVLHFATHEKEVKVFVNLDVKELLSRYKNVVYLNVERFRMKKTWSDERFQYIDVELLMQCYCYDEKKIRRMNEKAKARLRRSADAVTQVLNEKVYLKCPNCGASISLKDGGKCMYCDSSLDLAKLDWVIDRYEVFV
ncbi:MAG: GlsB/YeaQ/YmgE family stress response membrane protein [Agathobacter sp.]